MNTNLKWLRNALNYVSFNFGGGPIAFPTIPPDQVILFFKRDREHFRFLSNFHPSIFELDGCSWPSVEVYYQAQKSHNPDYKQAIQSCRSAGRAKSIGKDRVGTRRDSRQSWFRKHPEDLRPDWDQAKTEVMEVALHAKFSQNPYLKSQLLATFPAKLIEDSTKDQLWGIGKDGQGQNLLGKMLEELRQNLMES